MCAAIRRGGAPDQEGDHRVVFGVLSEIDGLAAAAVAAAVSTAGIAAVAIFGAVAERNAGYFSAFAVGLLSVAVVLHLIPETLDYSFGGIGWIFGGFAAMVLIGIAVQLAVSRSPEGAALTFGYASIIGLASHSFLDGVIYAAAFKDDHFTGWIATGGLLTHEFPEGIIAFFLLAHAGLSRVNAIALAFIAASLTTVAGTIAANAAIWLTEGPPMAAMLGAAAGALIYVLIVHLIPHAFRAPKNRGYLFAQLGVAVGVVALVLNNIAGSHAH